MKPEHASRIKLIVPSVIVLLLSQIFIAGLSVHSLEKIYLDFLTSSTAVAAKNMARKIELAIRFGKPLEKLLGVDTLFHETKEKNPDLLNIRILKADGQVIYELRPSKPQDGGSPSLPVDFSQRNEEKHGKTVEVLKRQESYHLLVPVEKAGEGWVGTIDLSFGRQLLETRLQVVVGWSLRVLTVTAAMGTLLLVLCLVRFVPFKPGTALPRRRILVLVSAILIAAQLFYAGVITNRFRNDYLDVTRNKVMTLTQLIRESVEGLLGKGIKIDRLVKIESMFEEIIRTTKEVDRISIIDVDGKELYRVVPGRETGSIDLLDVPATPSDPYEVLVPLKGPVTSTPSEGIAQDGVQGHLRVHISSQVVAGAVRSILLDSLTVVLISFLFSLELVIFLLILLKRQEPQQEEDEASLTYMLARPVAFLYLFSTGLSVSFIPLYMKSLYSPLARLNKEVVLALPISSEMLCAMFTALLAGIIIDKKGWFLPFAAGIGLSTAGAFLSGIAHSGFELVGYRGIAGLGYGLAWMSIQGYVFIYTQPQYRARAISNLIAGIFSGHICGTAVGAILAERMGYSAVFMLASALCLTPLPVILFCMRPYLQRRSTVAIPQIRFKDFVHLLADRNIVAVLALSMIPFSICQVGLLNYATPIYLQAVGATQSSIGRVLMIYGLSVITIAPWVSRYVDRSDNKKIFIWIGGLIGGLGLMNLYFFQGIGIIMGAIFMLGLASSIGGSAQSAYMLKLRITQEIGPGKAMSVQRAADKLGQMFGPILMGAMIANVGLERGIAFGGVFYIVASFVFALVAREERDCS
jgi:predicted MFS family arabinose efflux permease